MSANTKIEWTQRTWNLWTGCTEVSPGCNHCYAKTFAERWRGIPGHAFEHGFDFIPHLERLQDPFRWRNPQRVFVNSMSDVFHKDATDEMIAQVFAVMTFAGHHTFQVLTKRPDRMRNLLPKFTDGRVLGKALSLDVTVSGDRALIEQVGYHRSSHAWPPRNVWLGVSIESNDFAWRADMLRHTPAAVRWISAEPMLGPLDRVDLKGIDWVVAGGESGSGARPMHPEWVRDLRDRCAAAGVAFFFKQWGAWKPISQMAEGESDNLYHPLPKTRPLDSPRCKVETDVLQLDGRREFTFPKGAMQVFRIGKRAAGRLLDGRTWDEYPTIASAA